MSDDDSGATPFATLLPRVGAAVERHRRRVAARQGLTPTAIGVLAALDDGDGDDDAAGAPSHRDVAGRIGLSPGTLTPVLDVLEAAGHVRRERDPADRRIVRLRRTPLGRERLDAAEPVTLPEPDPADEPAVRAYLLAVLQAVEAADWPAPHLWLADEPVRPGTDGWWVFDDGHYVDLGDLGDLGDLQGQHRCSNHPIPPDVDLAAL